MRGRGWDCTQRRGRRLGQDATLGGVPLSRVRAGAAGVEGDLCTLGRDAARGGKQVALYHVVRVRLPRTSQLLAGAANIGKQERAHTSTPTLQVRPLGVCTPPGHT